MKRAATLTSLFVVLCLVSTVSQAVDFAKYDVKFDVKPNKGMVSIDSGNKNCDKGQGSRKGCIKFPQNSIGLVKFWTDKKDEAKTCAEKNTKWVISQVELSDQGYLVVDENDNSKTTVSEKGIFEGHLPLDNWMEDAFPQLNKATGFVYLAPTPLEGVTQVTILNLNNNHAAGGTKDVWYRVSFAKCGSDPVEILVSDPRFENDGTSN